MKPGTIRGSAQGAASTRTIESYRPPEERLFEDRLGSGFMDKPLWRGLVELCRLSSIRAAALAVQDWQYPGVAGNLVCRTRFIDDALGDALAEGALGEGVDQVVLLGAGFDTRAYRLPGIDRTRVFEVDHPATQAWKRARLQQILGTIPKHVVFVPVDLEGQTPGRVLAAAGLRTGARTFFVWEGVTQYFDQRAVDATFRYVAQVAAAGSRIAFTYIQSALIHGSNGYERYARVLQSAQQKGEPWISGFDPAGIASYLAARGLAVVDHAGAAEYRARYLEPLGRQMKIFEGERVVLAQVAGSWSELNSRHQ